MSGIVSMTMHEVDRISVIQALIAAEIKPQVAALRLGLSTRQVQRLVGRFSASGAAGLVSQQRGKASNRQLAPQLAQSALAIIRDRYPDFGPTLACEKLMECHGLALSKETVRQLMIQGGLWKTRGQRKAPLHQPRTRRASFGDLVQIDGSHHAWFEERGASCTLLVFVDDATGRLLQLHFAATESTDSYFAATHGYLTQHGKPLTFYSDKAAIFRNPRASGRNGCTQFHRALTELDINLICANSPQAKGRVERMNRSLQDRLVKELRILGISSIEAGNAACAAFMDDYNRRFARMPRNKLDLHRPVVADDDLDLRLAWRDVRKLTSKLTVQNKDWMYVIKDTPAARACIGHSVTVHTFPDDRRVEVRINGVQLEYVAHQNAPRAKGPLEIDGKNLDHVLDQAALSKKPRNRSYRNPTPAENQAGVAAAKGLAARKAKLGRPATKSQKSAASG
jgi:hypothetical protein